MKRWLIPHLIAFPLFCQAHPDDARFFAQGALLYWQAEEGGLSYAIESASSTKNLPFNWDFGFNVGLGYRIPHDTWQLLLQFTNLQTHTDAKSHADAKHALLPTWQTPLASALAATAHWRLHLGLIDLSLSKPLHATSTLTLTPQIGIRWGSIRQKYNIAYQGSAEEVLLRMKNKFWGIGPSLGAAGDYALTRSFSLIANASITLLYGQFYLHQDTDTYPSKDKLLGVHSLYSALSPALGAGAGLRWQTGFSHNRYLLAIELAWDQLILFSQNQLLRFAAAQPGCVLSNQGDLSLAGVHVGAALRF